MIGRAKSTLVLLTVVVVTALILFRRMRSMTEQEKFKLKGYVDRVFEWAERRGLIAHRPAFWRDYDSDYPYLRLLEQNYETIRDECLALLGHKEQLVDVEALGGAYTKGGIHAIQWKSVMFKSGEFVEENCALAPRTAALLKRLPNVYTAFFSILDPNQYLTPHWGYWRGFVRYHMGIVIPNNNEKQQCFLRINNDWADNDRKDIRLIERGEKYYWHNGEGVIFDDTFLHDAANYSDEVRVILWLDLGKKMPWYLDVANRIALAIAYNDPSVKQTRQNAIIRPIQA